MKRLKLAIALPLLALLALFNANTAHAQSNWELGLRVGNDIAIDATIPTNGAPRLHLAAYFDDASAVGAYFDWMFAIEDGPLGLKFYPGVGPELHFYRGLDIAAAGDFGVEYSFDFPLTVGFDWRPNIMITDGMNFNADRWGITARFRFGRGIKLSEQISSACAKLLHAFPMHFITFMPKLTV
jgi:hypothetical protein